MEQKKPKLEDIWDQQVQLYGHDYEREITSPIDPDQAADGEQYPAIVFYDGYTVYIACDNPECEIGFSSPDCTNPECDAGMIEYDYSKKEMQEFADQW